MSNFSPDAKRHPMKAVAQRTGLTTHVIRAWERRYGAVDPQRTDTNRRLFSDRDIERLHLLKALTHAGQHISHIARLSDQELKGLLADSAPSPGRFMNPHAAGLDARPAASDEPFCLEALDRIRVLDPQGLERILGRAMLSLSRIEVIERVLVPLMIEVGQLWETGDLRPVHEHLASPIIRTFLSNLAGAYDVDTRAPEIIVATPAGQLHELGAMMVAALAASEGWRVIYLGASLPAEEIAAAARDSTAAVAISIVYPRDDPRVPSQLQRLRQLLPGEIPLFVGGRGAADYEKVFRPLANFHQTSDLAEFRGLLRALKPRSVSSEEQL